MKKKFLSLMMAAAVVATTSVSAFAEVVRENVTYPDSANIISKDTSAATQDVTITGNVLDEKGNTPEGTFKVTVPTAATFTVNQTGAFVGANLTIKNEGSQEVEVYAQEFSNKGNGSISVVGEQTIADAKADTPRSTVSLKLAGDDNVYAYLASGDKAGVYGQEDLVDKATSGVKLLTLAAGDENNPTTKTIRLQGTAGGKKITDPVTDSFTLTLKIKKAIKS